jgi:hypothetical protein
MVDLIERFSENATVIQLYEQCLKNRTGIDPRRRLIRPIMENFWMPDAAQPRG